MAAPLTMTCPHCGRVMKLSDPSLVGRKGRCKACHTIFPLKPDVNDIELADGELPWWERPGAVSQSNLLVDDQQLLEAVDLPPKPVKKKKPKPVEPEQPRWKWRDEEGRLTLTLQYLLMGGGGLLAAGLAVGLWSSLIWLTSQRLGFLALLPGIAAGVSVCLGAGKHKYGREPAILAASAAVIVLTLGQLTATLVKNAKREAEYQRLRAVVVPAVTSTEGLIRTFADEVVASREEQDIEIDWSVIDKDLRDIPEQQLLQAPELFQETYPPDVWGEAEQLYEALSEDDVAAKKAEIEAQWEQGREHVALESRRYLKMLKIEPEQFTFRDLLYYIVSALLAYFIAGRLNTKHPYRRFTDFP